MLIIAAIGVAIAAVAIARNGSLAIGALVVLAAAATYGVNRLRRRGSSS